MRKIVMLGAGPRTQRSLSSVQLPVNFSSTTSSVPVFTYRTTDFIFDLRQPQSSKEIDKEDDEEAEKKQTQEFKDFLLARWEASREKNVFNYKLNCIYKLLDGDYNFSIQLNVERGELRRKPMRFRHIREPFNHLRWNFTKLREDEVIMYLKCEDRPISNDPLDRHIVAINASPLERGHSLVIPAVNQCLSQVLTETAIRLAVDLMLLANDDNFHILFNSLLGLASVNHLHLHALFWPYDSDLINRKFNAVEDIENVFYIRPPCWMTHAIAFQIRGPQDYDPFIRNLSRAIDLLTEKEVAHNLFFSRAQPIRLEGPVWEEDRRREKPQLVTAYLFPRASVTGAKPPTNFNPAACELAGCLTSYTWRFFETVSQQAAVRVVEEEALLTESQFMELVSSLSDILSGRTTASKSEKEGDWTECDLTSPELDELRDSFASFELRSPKRAPSRQRGGSFDNHLRPSNSFSTD